MLLYCEGISSMTDEQFELFFGLMPTERQKRAARYIKNEDKYLNVAAFALLSYALDLYGYKIGDYELVIAEGGKPYLKNCPLKFNLSHTKNSVACALSQGEIGVDIQHKNIEYRRVMHRVCCENEINMISASKNPADDFTKLWTLKESCVKCTGEGISANMQSFDFSSIVQSGGGNLMGYEFSVLDVGECAISVCSSTPIESIKGVSLSELYDFLQKNIM